MMPWSADSPNRFWAGTGSRIEITASGIEVRVITLDFPGGPLELQEYVMEVIEGIKDHLVRDPNDPKDTRWEYTYHQRLFKYGVPELKNVRPDRNCLPKTGPNASHPPRPGHHLEPPA
jgi:thymidylate synthase